ncbi:pescadillo [Tanacetum coccineum]
MQKATRRSVLFDDIVSSSFTWFLHHSVRVGYCCSFRIKDHSGDLDHCLTMVYFFAALPAIERESNQPERIHNCRGLSLEWQAYISHTHKLRKAFISVKGIYYQMCKAAHDEQEEMRKAAEFIGNLVFRNAPQSVWPFSSPVCNMEMMWILEKARHSSICVGLIAALGIITGLYVVLWGKAKDVKELKEEQAKQSLISQNDQINKKARHCDSGYLYQAHALKWKADELE